MTKSAVKSASYQVTSRYAPKLHRIASHRTSLERLASEQGSDVSCIGAVALGVDLQMTVRAPRSITGRHRAGRWSESDRGRAGFWCPSQVMLPVPILPADLERTDKHQCATIISIIVCPVS